jgi:hypothetical protein
MHGRVQSLNAAVAGSILLYEAAAQRGLPDAPPRPTEIAAGDDAAADAGSVLADEPADPPKPAADSPIDADAIAEGPTPAPTAARAPRKATTRTRTKAAADAPVDTAPVEPPASAGDGEDLLPEPATAAPVDVVPGVPGDVAERAADGSGEV